MFCLLTTSNIRRQAHSARTQGGEPARFNGGNFKVGPPELPC